MTNYREILRLSSLGLNKTQIAQSVGCSRTTVIQVLNIAEEKGVSYPLPQDLSDRKLSELLFPSTKAQAKYKMPDYEYIGNELRKSGVTLNLLWLEYCEECRKNGELPYQLTQFKKHYRDYAAKTNATMHLNHKPGEIMQVDWAGDTAKVVNTDTGELMPAYIFVASLPYSGYSYVEAFFSMNEECWITAHVNAFRYFGGVTRIVQCDNLKTGVTAHRKSEVILNKTYNDMAEHYGTAVLPCRVRAPKDKAMVEGTVGVISNFILAALRNRQFLSLSELNKAIFERLHLFNHKPFQKRDGSRASGIGGFRSGLEAVGGFECIGHCEIDPYPNTAYNAIFDTRGEYYCDDARKINPDEMPDFDLVCAGFPCQSFSVAGRRLGFEDTRGTLFFEVARLLKAKRPAFFLLENVVGLLSHDEGRTLETIYSALIEVGYCFEWCVLDSRYYVPQQRKRLYIVGYLDDRCAGEIFPLSSRDAKNLRQIIGGSQGQRVYDPDGIACTQCAGSGGQGGKTGLYFIDLNPDPKITDEARTIIARHNAGVTNHKGVNSGVLIEDKPRAIITPQKETVRQNGRRVKEPDEPMFTITATDRHGVVHEGRIRTLMPIECWRLQGFTDEQFYKAQAMGLSDARLYKMAGNSVTLPVISAIGEKIRAVNEKYQIVRCEP